MVYYSRYYIQEMLLVCFTYGAIVCGYRYCLYCRYSKERRLPWVIGVGICLGLMHATKETSVVVFGAMVTALALTVLTYRVRGGGNIDFRRTMNFGHVLLALGTAFSVSGLLYSSFLTHPRGIVDAFLTYRAFFDKAVHSEWHSHSWYFYLNLIRGETIVLIISTAGFVAAFFPRRRFDVDRNLLSFLAFYTLTSAFIYSAIPYKTPWSALGIYHGLILMAALGAAILLSESSKKWTAAISVFLIAGSIHLGIQAYLLNFKYEADPTNPYTYGHTSKDIFAVTNAVEEIAAIHPDGKNLFIEVICPDDDYWPLPWYLRSFTNIGWFDSVDFDIPAAPVIIASPRVESALIEKIYDLPPPGEKTLYVPLFDSYTEIRPLVEIRGYVTKEIGDRLRDMKER